MQAARGVFIITLADQYSTQVTGNKSSPEGPGMWMPNFAHVNNASTAAASTNAVTATAMRTDLGDRLYRAGPNSARKDTQTVIVKKMEIVVLTATI